jgi:hypothetical protein
MPKKGRPKGSRNKSGGGGRPAAVMRKQTKRGAYKKTVKSQLVMRRAPIVETKQRVHSDVAQINGYPAGSTDPVNYTNPLNWRPLPPDDAFTNIPLRSWTRISHGFGENQVIGNNLFSKFLNFKLQVRFPDGSDIQVPSVKTPGTFVYVPNKMIQKPTKLYLVCGWITESMNYPLNSDVSPSLPAQSDADVDALSNYITQQLKPFFDDDEDKLQFRPKQTTNIKIDKYVKIAPNLDNAIGTQAQPDKVWTTQGQAGYPDYSIVHSGSIPDVMRTWSTKTNRKIPLTEGKESTIYPIDKQNLYPNNSWVPFAVIYNPDYQSQLSNITIEDGEVSQTQMMQFRYNDAHYFTDS